MILAIIIIVIAIALHTDTYKTPELRITIRNDWIFMNFVAKSLEWDKLNSTQVLDIQTWQIITDKAAHENICTVSLYWSGFLIDGDKQRRVRGTGGHEIII